MYVIIDFGASRIKSACFSTTKKILNNYETKGSLFFSKLGIVKKSFFIKSFKQHLKFYFKKKYNFKYIIISSEMHGYFICSDKISDYYSWRCEYKKFIFTKKFKKNYLKSTGLTLRQGTPYANIINFKENCSVIGIAEFLCVKLGKYNKCLHSTYAQSLGIYNYIKTNLQIRNEIKNINQDIKINYNFNNYVGDVTVNNKSLKIFGGFGDMQCSNDFHKLKNNQAILNIGTGSQIIFGDYFNNLDFRIFFNKKIYSCITHIPSGRYLIKLSKIFKLNQIVFFKKLKKIKLNQIYSMKKKFALHDLKTFYGFIKKRKKKINDNVFMIVLYIFLNNYVNKLKKFKKTNELIIKGGIPRKLKIINEYFKLYFNVNLIKENLLDDTIQFIEKNINKIIKQT
jgi:hypothetical protein